MLLKFAIKDFLDDRAFRNVSAKSLANYEGTLNEFHAYCVAAGVVNVSDVRPATVKGYLLSCQRDKGNKPSSINHKLQNLRVFFNYLEQEGIIEHNDNPARKVSPAKADVHINTYTDQQVKEMLGYFRRMRARDKSFYAYRDYVIVMVLLGTGMRLGELVNLKWSDVDFVNQVITVMGKKRQQSSIPMLGKLKQELAEYKVFVEQTLGNTPEYVFTDSHGVRLTDNGVKCIFKRLKKVMGFHGVRLSAHTFRHTFAVRMVKAGADAFTVQKMLRHSALSTTMRYVNLYGTALKEQNDKYNPLNGIDV